jgi:hypothetical protein
MYMYEAGAHQQQRHRPLPDTFRPALPPGLQHLARRFMPEDLRARLQHFSYLEASQDDLVPSENMPELPEMVRHESIEISVTHRQPTELICVQHHTDADSVLWFGERAARTSTPVVSILTLHARGVCLPLGEQLPLAGVPGAEAHGR